MSKITYVETNVKECEWVLEKKENLERTYIDNLVVDTVILDLNNEYYKEIGCDSAKFDSLGEGSYWSCDNCYVEDEVFKVFINGTSYILSHLYVTQNNRIVVVVVKPKNMDAEDISELLIEVENLEPIYFVVEY